MKPVTKRLKQRLFYFPYGVWVAAVLQILFAFYYDYIKIRILKTK